MTIERRLYRVLSKRYCWKTDFVVKRFDEIGLKIKNVIYYSLEKFPKTLKAIISSFWFINFETYDKNSYASHAVAIHMHESEKFV